MRTPPLLLLPLLVTGLAAAPTTNDTFTRTISSGWGSTPQSQAYTVTGGTTSDFNVDGSRGGIRLSSSASRLARVPLSLTNFEGTVRVALDSSPTANHAHAGPAVRVQGASNDCYVFRLQHAANGTVTLGIRRIVSGAETTLGSDDVVATTYTPGTLHWIRYSAAGASPTHLRAKAWADGAPEPALWQVETTDSTAGLQTPGGAGLQAGSHASFAPLNSTYQFDDFQVHHVAYVADLKVAMQNAVAGDILYFTGLHTGNMKTFAHGTAAAPIIVRGINATVQTASQSTGYGVEVLHDYWRFDDFTINYAKKGFYCFNADHGVATRIDITNMGQEAFKFRRYTNFWEVVSCTVDGAGQSANDYGEGFYVGDAQSNWESSTTPDTSGYITFRNCYTVNTTNDGYDLKEGAHHVKYINCVADFSGIEPVGGHARGDSGFYLRGDDIQLIGCSVNDLNNGSTAFNMANLEANGTDYGNRIEFKAVTATNITNNGAMFEIQSSRSDGIVIYDDYTATNVANFKIGSGTYTLAPAASFVEMSFTGPSITTTSLPNGLTGTPYSQQLQASGGTGPLTWSITTGSLPAGLSLSSGGLISGTPTTAGTSNFTVRVQDANADSDTRALSITIAPSSPPAAPSGLTAVSPRKKVIDLAWTDNATSEDGFRIERSTNGTSFTEIATVGANVTSFTNSGLSSGVTYYYRVRAYNSAGNSSYSNTASAVAK